ncbi:MAG: hypothetical protein IH899_00050 [Planctomycetes bacterium]|nr:hypothetical protein [Planctomycetota bacterium]
MNGLGFDSLEAVAAGMNLVFGNTKYLVFGKNQTELGTEKLMATIFPGNESMVSAYHFLKKNLKPNQRILGPKEFVWLGIKEFDFIEEICYEDQKIQWAVIEREYGDSFQFGKRKKILQDLRPVFANGSYIIFSDCYNINHIIKLFLNKL